MIMIMTVGPLTMPAVEADPELAARVVARVRDWDRTTPDPFRDQLAAASSEMRQKILDSETALARLPDQLRESPERVAKARAEDEKAEHQVKIRRAEICAPGVLDSVDAEGAMSRIRRGAEAFVKNHPFVVSQLGGAVKTVYPNSEKRQPPHLPTRLMLDAAPPTGWKYLTVVLDVDAHVTPDRKLGSVKISLACVTQSGPRDPFKDICDDEDPRTRKPPHTSVREPKQSDLAR